MNNKHSFMKKITLLFLMLFSFGFTFSQIDVNQLFANHPEVVIKFQIQDRSQLELLTRLVSIDNVSENEVTAYTNQEEFEQFLSLNIPFEIVERQVLSPEELNMLDFEGFSKSRGWDSYPTYQGYLDMMTQFATNYPQLCRLVEFGTSVQGRKLLACVISNNVNMREAEPQVFWSSSMHGDELVGYVLTLRFIDYLLTNYGINGRITHLLDNLEIWVNPLANPDGTFYGGNNSVSGATRYNANTKDLNRNYPDDTYGGNVPTGYGPLQKETNAFIALQQTETFTLAVNLHGGAEIANYPWDNKTTQTADHNWWKYVCREYVDTVQFYKPTYMKGTGVTGNDNGIVWGWQWYQVYGGRQDYANYYDHTREFCLEISNTKTPAASQLPNYWDGHYRSFLNYTQQALYGVQGVVTDAGTGEPLHAKISLSKDIHNSFIFTDPRVGFYARYLEPGTYSLLFEADGYQSKTISGVSSQLKNTTILNVALQKLNTFSISGLVLHAKTGLPLENVKIEVKDTPLMSVTTNESGSFTFYMTGGTYQLVLYKEGFVTKEQTVVVNENIGSLVITLEPLEGFPYIEPKTIVFETEKTTGDTIITITNTGNALLTFTATVENEDINSWLTLSNNTGTLNENEKQEIVLSYDFTSMDCDTYETNVQIFVGDSVINVPVSILFTGCEEEEIGIPSVSIDSIDIETFELSEEYIIVLENTGNKAFDYALSIEPEECEWLSLSHKTGELAPGEQVEIVLTFHFEAITKVRESFSATLIIKVLDTIIQIPITITLLPNSIETFEPEEITVYPNPTNGQLRITNYELRIDNIEVYDVFSKKQLSIVNCQLSIEKIDISLFPAGVYLVKIQTDKGMVMKKVVKY